MPSVICDSGNFLGVWGGASTPTTPYDLWFILTKKQKDKCLQTIQASQHQLRIPVEIPNTDLDLDMLEEELLKFGPGGKTNPLCLNCKNTTFGYSVKARAFGCNKCGYAPTWDHNPVPGGCAPTWDRDNLSLGG